LVSWDIFFLLRDGASDTLSWFGDGDFVLTTVSLSLPLVVATDCSFAGVVAFVVWTDDDEDVVLGYESGTASVVIWGLKLFFDAPLKEMPLKLWLVLCTSCSGSCCLLSR
jgi:hypothetical protein